MNHIKLLKKAFRSTLYIMMLMMIGFIGVPLVQGKPIDWFVIRTIVGVQLIFGISIFYTIEWWFARRKKNNEQI